VAGDAPGRRRKRRLPADDSPVRLSEHPAMNSMDLRARLTLLHLERLEAESAGMTACETYMRDLDDEICHCRAAFTGAVVTELAVARAERSGRLYG
jgi:hypothetical protein